MSEHNCPANPIIPTPTYPHCLVATTNTRIKNDGTTITPHEPANLGPALHHAIQTSSDSPPSIPTEVHDLPLPGVWPNIISIRCCKHCGLTYWESKDTR